MVKIITPRNVFVGLIILVASLFIIHGGGSDDLKSVAVDTEGSIWTFNAHQWEAQPSSTLSYSITGPDDNVIGRSSFALHYLTEDDTFYTPVSVMSGGSATFTSTSPSTTGIIEVGALGFDISQAWLIENFPQIITDTANLQQSLSDAKTKSQACFGACVNFFPTFKIQFQNINEVAELVVKLNEGVQQISFDEVLLEYLQGGEVDRSKEWYAFIDWYARNQFQIGNSHGMIQEQVCVTNTDDCLVDAIYADELINDIQYEQVVIEEVIINVTEDLEIVSFKQDLSNQVPEVTESGSVILVDKESDAEATQPTFLTRIWAWIVSVFNSVFG